MKKIIYSFLLLLSANPFAQLPNTDIWLLDISSVKDSIILSNPVNITNRAGYDNQPVFSPDGKYILYTSIRDEKQSDIYKYDLKTKTSSQFTKTTTSEYSPTFMPDGKNISVVMVEPDSAQRLWKFPLKGGAPICIMKDVDSIGYHCWINKDSLALVMITEPASLYTVNIKTQKPKFFADNVGRCMIGFYNFGNEDRVMFNFSVRNAQNAFLYMDQLKDKNWEIKNSIVRYDSIGKGVTSLELKSSSEDFAFLLKKDPVVFFGNKTSIIGLNYYVWPTCNGYQMRIFCWGYKTVKKVCDSDLSKYGIKNITRLAISPDGKKIAIVAESKE